MMSADSSTMNQVAYTITLWPNRTSPSTGMRCRAAGTVSTGRGGMSGNWITPLVLKSWKASTTVNPEAKRLVASPVMKTFARRYSVIAPNSRASSIEQAIPSRIPARRLPVAAAKTMLKKAPVRISPSSAMLSMPASSVYNPPMAASRNGVLIPTALWMSGMAKGEFALMPPSACARGCTATGR